MKGAAVRFVGIGIAMLLAFLAVWAMTYPSESDPKNIKYVLWKAGLFRMDLDHAAGTMIGDPSRDKLVLGKTKGQLRDRFGFLVPPAEASAYLRTCYESSGWKGKDVLFIRRTNWMVVFNGDSASELVLIKGC